MGKCKRKRGKGQGWKLTVERLYHGFMVGWLIVLWLRFFTGECPNYGSFMN
jgi:hypothetical protein